MPNSNRNRHSQKGNEKENRTGKNTEENTGYKKLPDNPRNRPDESISTAGNTALGQYSKTKKRKEDIERERGE